MADLVRRFTGVMAGVGAALVLSAAASGAVSPVPLDAGATKPSADATVGGQAGTVVTGNGGIQRHGLAAARASIVFAKSLPSFTLPVSPGLQGYVVVDSGPLVNHELTGEFGDVHCPTGKVALSGGVFGDSTSLYQHVQTSQPLISNGVADGWDGEMINRSASDSTFSVYAVCAQKPATYTVVISFFNSNPTGGQSQAAVQCPLAPSGKQMKVFGGGAFGYSESLYQAINSSFPVAGSMSWRVDMNNTSEYDDMYDVYAICGLEPGYEIDAGSAATNPGNTQTFAHALCPSGKTPIGGGIFSDAADPTVNLNATSPESSFAWESYEDNATSHDYLVTPYAVCVST